MTEGEFDGTSFALYFPYVISKILRLLILLILLLCAALASAQERKAIAALDSEIAKLMAGKPGAVVALDVVSGKIVAESNLKTGADRVTAPGSTLKPFVLLELLQSGKLDPEQRLVCSRRLTIAGRSMDCTHSPAITHLDAADAIAYSCNSYFAQAATRLTPAELATALERAGFASRTELVADEAVGRIATAGDRPHQQLQALGYWGVEVTPLELLAAYRKLALHKLKNDLPSSAAPVFAGLERSVQYGMAHSETASPGAIPFAGKTGTAAGASARTHGFFVGYAPADKPEIVLVVYLEQGRGADAAAIAAPIFSAYAKSRANGAAR
jgi:cell division protein FtsI/penicillin-binding protein 2